ncbi:MAG TPA: hypothetical protein VEH01_02035 [Nitrososphaerales archaeon]|nr:hypothetical protein [Nitrososphaerales archaeon]
MADFTDALLGPVIIIIADIIVLTLVGRLGSRSSGSGAKYQPFTGGESEIPTRGTYQSSLFVFPVLFLVVEAFAFLLAGSFLAPGDFSAVVPRRWRERTNGHDMVVPVRRRG